MFIGGPRCRLRLAEIGSRSLAAGLRKAGVLHMIHINEPNSLIELEILTSMKRVTSSVSHRHSERYSRNSSSDVAYGYDFRTTCLFCYFTCAVYRAAVGPSGLQLGIDIPSTSKCRQLKQTLIHDLLFLLISTIESGVS